MRANRDVAGPDDGELPRAHGHLGCRRFTASFRQEESHLRFAAIAVSQEDCTAGEATEAIFRRVLDECTSYRVDGETLLLYGQDETIARLVAVYLR